MSEERPLDYAASGVDIDRSDDVKHRIRAVVESTFTAGARGAFGGFGGMFRIPADFQRPVLVSSADGVGTKLRVAIEANRHDTVGHDLVNHCVNDILVQGARPLFFLDYIATGVLAPDVVASIVEGITNGCRENNCVLLGGETAEMPGFYAAGEYDVAGFIVGVVDREQVIDGRRIAPNDTVLALPSVGLHTNGYSLARKLFFDVAGDQADTHIAALDKTIGAALLEPHKSYLPALERLLDANLIKGLAHITGGGLTENIPRILPEGTAVQIRRGSWPVLPIFQLLQDMGKVEEAEMYRTFNMGIGMVVVCSTRDAAAIRRHSEQKGTQTLEIGSVIEGARNVSLV